MKFEQNKKYFIISVYGFFTALAVIICYLVLSNLELMKTNFDGIINLAIPFIWGISLAYLLNPVMKFCEKHLVKLKLVKKKPRLKRSFSLLFTYVFLFAMLALLFSIILPEISKSLSTLFNNVTSYIGTAENWITNQSTEYFQKLSLTQAQIEKLLAPVMDLLYRTDEILGAAISYTFNFLVNATLSVKNILIAVVISIYLLIGKETFIAQTKKIVYSLSGDGKASSFLELCVTSNRIFSGFISGKILDSIIIGIICFICLTIFKINYAMLISVIIGVTNVIPFFGPFIGAIPSILLLLLVSPQQALFFAVFVLILQQFDGNILGPKILGDATGLTAFWVIFAVIFAGGLFGLVGMFIGVPIFAIIYTIVKTAVEKQLTKKGMPIATEEYKKEFSKEN